MKLVGGKDSGGQLVVCFNQRWGTVNGDGWSERDTDVACRQLGLRTSGELAIHIRKCLSTRY